MLLIVGHLAVDTGSQGQMRGTDLQMGLNRLRKNSGW